MRNLSAISIAFLCIFGLYASNSNALPCKGFWCKKDSGSASGKPAHGLYMLNLGMESIQPGAFNPWLISNGFAPVNDKHLALGLSEDFVKGKWLTEYNTNLSLNKSNGPTTCNVSIGVGYNFWNTPFFSAYGAVGLGVNIVELQPGYQLANEFGKYNQPDDAYLDQFALLINPHIILYRNLTPNLNPQPGHIGHLGLGLEFGYNLTLAQSQWMYGYSKGKPFEAVPVSSIPTVNYSGFYGMVKLGWFFGKQ